MYAAIDIGSNAVRLAILQDHSSETTVIRVPIRLGNDTFNEGRISEKSIKKLIKAHIGFKRILDDNGVKKFRAVATSALRESKNGQKVMDQVEKKTGIRIDLISGKVEAQLIRKAVLHELKLRTSPHIIMDIGGGSVEFIAADHGEIKHIETLKIGTVRLLSQYKNVNTPKTFEKIVAQCEGQFEELKKIHTFCKNHKNLKFIGTGGNYRRVKKLNLSLNKKKVPSPVLADEFNIISDTLLSHSFTERVERLGLRKDRADVIIPASALITAAIQKFDINKLYIPQSGLKDGVILDLMEKDIKRSHQ